MNRKLLNIILAAVLSLSVLSGCATEKADTTTKEESGLTLEDLGEYVSGIEDHYILQDAKEIDFLYGVAYDENVIKEVEVDASEVDFSKTGTYKVLYTLTVDLAVYENSAESEDSGENSLEKVDFEIMTEVVDEEKAQSLLGAGKAVWTDKNESLPIKKDETEKVESEKAEEPVKKEEEKKPAAGNTSNPDQGNKKPANSSTENKKPQSSSNASNNKPATPSHSHDWVAVTETIPHAEEGHYETVTVQEAWDEPIYEYGNICNGCGAFLVEDPTLHCANCKSGYHSGKRIIGYTNHEAVTESVWVVDKAAWTETVTTGYKCSCGATK